MNNNKRFIVLFLLHVLLLQTAGAQNIADSTFSWFFKNVSNLYGNVSLNSVYPKTDTAVLRKMYPTELENELSFIKKNKMRCIDVDTNKLNRKFFNIKTEKEFYKERMLVISLPVKDSIYMTKEEKLFRDMATTSSDNKVYDDLNSIQNLLLMSSFSQIYRNRAAEAEAKHMTVLGIYESENMYLIIYRFMMRQGYAHYYVKSDLILK